MKSTPIRLGTRASNLARWQTDYVISLLQRTHPERTFVSTVISTRGDRVLETPLPLIGGKGLFTQELEQSLLDGTIDFAVHSLKDLPTDETPGLIVGAVPARASVEDVLVSKDRLGLQSLPRNAVVGTSSRRRAAQLRRARPDLSIHDIRGNVETRIRKALHPDSPYAATVLARAGLERLDLTAHIAETLSVELMLPAPGQGALAVQCRDEAESLHLVAAIADDDTAAAVAAERAFLAALEGGCSVPVAALAHVKGDRLHMHGRVADVNGHRSIDVHGDGPREDASLLGQLLADQAADRGASEILAALRPPHQERQNHG